MSVGSNGDGSWTVSIDGTTVRVKPAVLLNLGAMWAGLTWWVGRRRPGWGRGMRWLAALLELMALAAADFGHAFAHLVSARAAGTPVDEVLLSSGMPRTLYRDNDVPPRVHRTRALGGPIYSAIGLLTSALLHRLARRDTLAAEVAGWSAIGHGFILGGSLLPLPMVDGGTILKSTLMEHGYSELNAEAAVSKAAGAVAAGSFAAGVIMARRRRWPAALGFLALALVVLGGGVREVRADGD
jgi:hypothetical protein